jgi:hypothetical protein
MTVGVAIVLIASTSAGAQSHHKAPDGCPPSGRHTVIAADAQAEVYGVRKNSETIEYRGCVYGHTRWFDVGGRSECLSAGGACGGTDHITLAGTLVARESSFVGSVLGTEWIIEVEDLRDGRILHRLPSGVTFPPNPKFVGDGPATSIVVKSDGAVAWILDTVQEHERYQVHAVDRTGSRVLATGSDIDPHSLALAGSTLYWTQGGNPYSTTLN